MRVGYARGSISDQNPELRLDALRRAGCERVFTEKGAGAWAIGTNTLLVGEQLNEPGLLHQRKDRRPGVDRGAGGSSGQERLRLSKRSRPPQYGPHR